MNFSRGYFLFNIPGKIFLIFLLVFLYTNRVSAQFTLQEEKSIDLIVLLDRSGSMLANDPNGLAIPAVQIMISELSFLKGKSRILIIPFGTTLDYIPFKQKTKDGFFSNDYSKISDAVKSFAKLKPVQNLTYTYLEAALIKAKQKFIREANPESEKHIVIITDGVPMPPPDGKYKDMGDQERLKKSSLTILNLAKSFNQYNIITTFIGLFKENSSDYDLALQFVEDYKNRTLTRFVEIDTADKIIETVLSLFPKNEKIIDLYENVWNKNFLFPDKLRIREIQAYILMGENQVKSMNLKKVFDTSEILRDKSGNIAFITGNSRSSNLLIPSSLPFSPKIYIKGRTDLRIELQIKPYRENYSSGDNIKFRLKVVDEQNSQEIKYEKVFCDFMAPGITAPIYFEGDSASFMIPDNIDKTYAKIDLKIIISEGIKLNKTMYWKISKPIENTFVVHPTLVEIDFMELGNNLSETFNLERKFKLSLAKPSLKKITPEIKFEFDDGFLSSDWFTGKIRIKPILPSISSKPQSVELPEIRIQVPKMLDPYFENKKYTGNVIIYADGVSDLYIPFSYNFIRPAWEMQYQYINTETSDVFDEERIRYLNFFNIYFNKISIGLNHDSGYPQNVIVAVDSNLKIKNKPVEKSILKLIGDTETEFEIGPGESYGFKVDVNRNVNALENGFYDGNILVKGERLPSIKIPFALLFYNRLYFWIILAVPFVFVVIFLLRNRLRWDSITQLSTVNRIDLPCRITSNPSASGTNRLVLASNGINKEDIEFSIDQDGIVFINNYPGRNDVYIDRFGERISVSGSEIVEEQDQITLYNRNGQYVRCRVRGLPVEGQKNELRCNISSNLQELTPTFGQRFIRQITLPILLIFIADYFIGSFPNELIESTLALVFYTAILLFILSFQRVGIILLTIFIVMLGLTGIF